MLNHGNKVKVLLDQLAYLNILVRNKDIFMKLFESLLALYEYLITTKKMILKKKLMMDYVISCLMGKISKRK